MLGFNLVTTGKPIKGVPPIGTSRCHAFSGSLPTLRSYEMRVLVYK